MRRGTKIVLGSLLVALLLATAGAAYLLRQGYSALEKPPAIEEALARRLRHLATPAGARKMSNPVPPTPETLAHARAHFADHCAICHANDGSGETAIGQGLYPKAPDMRKRETQEMSDGELFYVIRNGIRFTGMPGWGSGPAHEDRDSWALVHLIRHLPRISSEELAEMKRLNPKTRRELEEEMEAEEFLRGGEAPGASLGPSTPARRDEHRH